MVSYFSFMGTEKENINGLNPYCSGRWSRTAIDYLRDDDCNHDTS